MMRLAVDERVLKFASSSCSTELQLLSVRVTTFPTLAIRPHRPDSVRPRLLLTTMAQSPPNRTLLFDPSTLPIGQLESTKFRISQIMESIQALQRILDGSGQNPLSMPAWPDILAKYNILLSQTHNLSTSLLVPQPSGSKLPTANGTASTAAPAALNPLARLALHPSFGLPDAQLDNDLAPLLRNQQTTEVLRVENDTVRRLSERLKSVAASKDRPAAEMQAAVLAECAQIRAEHDARCERAVRAVAMLREKYDWRARVAIETEEPEDFVPISPHAQAAALSPHARMSPIPALGLGGGVVDEDVVMGTPGDDGDDSSDSSANENDDNELEEVLGPSLQPTPDAEGSVPSTPAQ